MKCRRNPGKTAAAAILFLMIFLAGPGCSGNNLSSTRTPAILKTQTGATGTVMTATTPAGAFRFQPLAFPASMPSPARIVKVPILMYHHIGSLPPRADLIRRGLTVSAANFSRQMSYLKESGFHPVSQAALFEALFENEPLPDKPVVISFDDGYRDNFTQALPILESCNFTATFNIITAKVGIKGFMSWNQILELQFTGMDIGSHTVDHQDLSILSGPGVRHELIDSEQTLASHLGHPVYWLCYPSGAYNARVIAVAREAGYLLATTTHPGAYQSSAKPFELNRLRVRNDTTLTEFEQLLR